MTALCDGRLRRAAETFTLALLITSPAVAQDVPAAAAGNVAVAPLARYAFQAPLDDVIPYHGTVNMDDAGLGARSVLYVAPGLIGLAVELAAHSVIVNTMQAAEKKRIENRADEILVPYTDVIAHFNQRELLERSFLKMNTAGDKSITLVDTAAGLERVIGYAPAFAISQDGRALILENVVSIGSGATAYRNTIRVVSDPPQAEDPAAYWTAEGGLRFKDESARLLAISFDVALSEAVRNADAAKPGPQKTIRYRFGNAEKIERAELLQQTCDRVLVRTLRGWLMSAPRPIAADAGSGAPACEVAAAVPAQ
jgi:hypothetical protein